MNRKMFVVLLGAIIALGIFMRVLICDLVQTHNGFFKDGAQKLLLIDDYTYTVQAETILKHGILALRTLEENYKLENDLKVVPLITSQSRLITILPIIQSIRISLSRIGYSFLFADSIKFTHIDSVNTGIWLSCFFSLMSLLLVLFIGLRFFDKYTAFFASLFFSVSAMDITTASIIRPDALLGFLALLCIYACCEIVRKHKNKWSYILFFAVSFYGALVKESFVIFSFLCLAWVGIYIVLKEKKIYYGILMLLGWIFTQILALSLIIYVVGGIDKMIVILRLAQLSSQLPYAILFQKGYWYSFGFGFSLISSLSTIFWMFGSLCAYFKRNSAQIIKGLVFILLGFIVAIILFNPKYGYNMRFISPIFGLFYLIAGYGFSIAIQELNKFTNVKKLLFVAGFVLAVSAINDIIFDYQFFSEYKFIDMPIGWVKAGGPHRF